MRSSVSVLPVLLLLLPLVFHLAAAATPDKSNETKTVASIKTNEANATTLLGRPKCIPQFPSSHTSNGACTKGNNYAALHKCQTSSAPISLRKCLNACPLKGNAHAFCAGACYHAHCKGVSLECGICATWLNGCKMSCLPNTSACTSTAGVYNKFKMCYYGHTE